MTYCNKLFEGLDRRLQERKSLEDIGKELCDTVDDPRGKAIRLIKAHKGEEYLIENAAWLGYNISHNLIGGKPHSQEDFIQKNLDKELEEVDVESDIENPYADDRRRYFNPDGTGTPKHGEIASMLIAETELPEGKGFALLGTLVDCGRSLYLLIIPAKQKGFHYMVFTDWGRCENLDEYIESDGGRGAFGKKAIADAWLDFALKVYRWTPLGCKWEWTSVITDRWDENPLWSHADEVRSWELDRGKV